MGRTAADVGALLYRHLKNSALYTDEKKPNGTLCRDQRPLNSTAEDVVINVVSLDDAQIQTGEVEVYVYVPNLENKAVTPIDKSQPNTGRLTYLTNLIGPLLRNTHLGGCYIATVKHLPCEPDANNQHYAKYILAFNGMNL